MVNAVKKKYISEETESFGGEKEKVLITKKSVGGRDREKRSGRG